MKKKITILMLVVCLVIWGGGISASAADEAKCPYCDAKLLMGREHLGHWFQTRTFKDENGKSVECHENCSVDRDVIYCSKNGHIIWTGKEETTVAHTLPSCPYR